MLIPSQTSQLPNPLLKPNIEISFTNKDNESCIAKIIYTAGKTIGKHNTCYNIEYKTPSNFAGIKTWIDSKKFKWLINFHIWNSTIRE